MLGQKLIQFRGFGGCRRAILNRLNEAQEFFSVLRGETIGRMSDDIGVLMLAQLKTHREPARPSDRQVIIGNRRQPGEIG